MEIIHWRKRFNSMARTLVIFTGPIWNRPKRELTARQDPSSRRLVLSNREFRTPERRIAAPASCTRLSKAVTRISRGRNNKRAVNATNHLGQRLRVFSEHLATRHQFVGIEQVPQ